MRFVCEHCDTKYNIADSKVRNKTLKIRCRKCGEVIEVRGPAASSVAKPAAASKASGAGKGSPAAAGRSKLEDRFAGSFKQGRGGSRGTPGLFEAVKESAQTLARDETEQVVWFVAVNDSPVGPIAARDVQRYVRAKKVGDDSLVWKEGMPDWVPLRNAKELVGLLARLELQSALGGEPAAERKPGAKPKLGLFDEPPPDAAASGGPLKGRDVGRVDVRHDAPPPATEPPADDVEPTSADAAPAPGQPAEPPEPSPAKRDLDDELFDDFALGMKSSVASIKSITPARIGGTDRWIKVAAVGFFVVAVVVLGLVLYLGGGAAESEAAETVVKVVEKVVEKEKIVYRDRPVVPTEGDDEGAAGNGEAEAKKGKGGKGRGGGGKGSDEAAEEKKRKLLEQMGMLAPSSDPKLVGGKSGDQASGSGAASGDDSSALSKSQLTGVVRKNRGSAQTCYERALKQGEAPEGQDVKVVIAITVGASGMVKRASVSGPGARYTGLKSCLTQTVKKWIFPASSGESNVEYPFLFTPK